MGDHEVVLDDDDFLFDDLYSYHDDFKNRIILSYSSNRPSAK